MLKKIKELMARTVAIKNVKGYDNARIWLESQEQTKQARLVRWAKHMAAEAAEAERIVFPDVVSYLTVDELSAFERLAKQGRLLKDGDTVCIEGAIMLLADLAVYESLIEKIQPRWGDLPEVILLKEDMHHFTNSI